MTQRTRLLPRATYHRDAFLCVVAVEGEREELWYFRGLRDHGWVATQRVKVEVLPAEEGLSSPRQVAARLDAFEQDHTLIPQDQRWLVVDVDRHGASLHDALQEARDRSWSVAVSNPCFEVWLQLHWVAHPEGTTSGEAKAAWRRLRQARSDPWPFATAEIAAAVTRAASLGSGHDHIPTPAPATGVFRLVDALPRAAP